MQRNRILAVAATVAMVPTATYAAGGPASTMLECRCSENEYKNGLPRWPNDTQDYYRIELRQSDAVVSFQGMNGNYSSGDRYDLRTSSTSYKLTVWWNKNLTGTYIDIDRLNGDFAVRIINDGDGNYTVKGFGSCSKVDDTPNF
jgi:hypothetical protein